MKLFGTSSETPYYAANTGLAPAETPVAKNEPVIIEGQYLPPDTATATATDAETFNKSNPETSSDNVNSSSFSTVPHGVPDGDNNGWTKGQIQPKRCNDFFFGLLFYVHLGLMGWAASKYGSQMLDDVADAYADYSDFLGGYYNRNGGERKLMETAIQFVARRRLEDNNDNNDNDGYQSNVGIGDITLLIGISTVFCGVVSSLALLLLMHFSKGLIKSSLIFNVVVSIVVSISAFMAGSPFGGIMFIILTLFMAYYAWAVWSRIPFAATNLKTAVTSIQKNGGLTFIAYGSLLFLFGWSIWWSVAFIASMYVTGGCSADGVCENEINGWIVFLFLLSYFWTHQIIKNTVHVTVAGAVGTWWFTPLEAASCCSRAVRDSFLRAITLSFGSICFGSLIVAIVQATKNMLKSLRERGDSVLLCCAECLLSCLETLIECFNSWAFVFVGLYGYSFIDAGRNVITLFKSRGWTTIITDNLVDSVLFLVSIGVGLLTGIIASLLAHSQGMIFGNESGSLAIPFVIGLVIGFVLTSVMMSVVSSAVNTVIVCYAVAPNEFQTNHPELSEEMRNSWRQAWPVDFKY